MRAVQRTDEGGRMNATGQWVVVSVYDAYGDFNVSSVYGPFAHETDAQSYRNSLYARDRKHGHIEYNYEIQELWSGPVDE